MDSNQTIISDNILANALKPVTESLNGLIKSLMPYSYIQNEINQFASALLNTMSPYTKLSMQLSQVIEGCIADHANNLKSLSEKIIDVSSFEISSKSLEVFSNNILAIMNEIDFNSIPKDVIEVEHQQIISDVKAKKKPLTWEQVIIIITFIITLVTFIQAQIPDKQLSEIENCLNNLIKLENKELNMINQDSVE
jgi:hypothetical protein